MISAILFGVIVFLVIHVTLWRVYPSNDPRVALLAALSLVGILASELFLYAESGWDSVNSFVVFGFDVFLFIFYGMLYGIAVRSVSVTLLIRMLAADHMI